MNLKNAKRPMIFLGMILCLGWLVTGCATSQQLAEVRDQANLAMETAETALLEAGSAKTDSARQVEAAEAAAASAGRDADRAESAAVRAERAANKAEAMADKAENIFTQKLKK